MHVLHVVRDLDTSSGGPSRSVPALANEMAKIGSDLTVSLAYQDRGAETSVDHTGAKDVNLQAVPAKLGAKQLQQRFAEIDSGCPVDFVHIHGLWSPTLHAVAAHARERGVPYAISPRGMLSPWCLASKRWKKQLGWVLYQARDLRRASFIHATSEAEQEDCIARGVGADIRIVPNGCHPAPQVAKALPEDFPVPSGQLYAIAIARMHPVKGFDRLIQAWQECAPVDWHLVLTGPGDATYLAEIDGLIAKSGRETTIHRYRPLSHDETWPALQSAQLFICSSHSENFGMAIAEALASGTPVITTEGTPWQLINERRCGWWVPGDCSGLGTAISAATTLPERELTDMGQRGLELIQTQYAWPAIARRMVEHYESFI